MFILALSILISLSLRILADALHIPGYYDCTGVYFSATLLPFYWSILSHILIALVLSLYYQVYIVASWIIVLSGLVYWLLYWRAPKSKAIIVYIIVPVIYSFSWIILYSILTNTIKYLPLYIRMKGFYILLFDSVVSITLGNFLARTVTVGALLNKRSYTIVATVFSILLIVGYASVLFNEWSITQSFPEHDGYLKFHAKMDFVWLPLGEKGINNYYYPIDRFKRGSLGYQVWIGMYWIQGYHDIADVGLVSQFAIWDQNFWLGIHGAPDPYTYVDLVENITVINFKGYKAYLMYGGMISRSDVEPYEEVILRGFFITFYDERSDRTAIVYACATSDNIDKVIGDLWKVVNSWNIR